MTRGSISFQEPDKVPTLALVRMGGDGVANRSVHAGMVSSFSAQPFLHVQVCVSSATGHEEVCVSKHLAV